MEITQDEAWFIIELLNKTAECEYKSGDFEYDLRNKIYSTYPEIKEHFGDL
jgi:hypothetical protein